LFHAGGQPKVDPAAGLAFLEYVRFLLHYYQRNCPVGGQHGGGPSQCDFTRYKKCTCKSPAQFSPDGRGNCNLGVTKADKQVWCYISERHGHPKRVCPDARPSTSRPGFYWSRFACITE